MTGGKTPASESSSGAEKERRSSAETSTGTGGPSAPTTADDPNVAPQQPNVDSRSNHDISIKKQFVHDKRPACLTQVFDQPARTRDDAQPTDSRDDNNGKNGKKRRGQNKKRPRDSKISNEEKLCLAVVKGLACPFSSSSKGCRYNHDLKAYLSTRPADLCDGPDGVTWLKGECPFWKTRGYCDFGVMCRLGQCHINMSTGQNLCRTTDASGVEVIGLPSNLIDSASGSMSTTGTAEKKPAASGDKLEPSWTFAHQSEVLNTISRDTITLLRKDQYPFVCKRHFEVKKEKDAQKNGLVIPKIEDTSKPTLPLKERKLIDFSNKVYIAPLTTVGNLPYRRIMKNFGADITCGEMALADQLLQGRQSEWALLKRHASEDVFGVQIASGHPDQYTRICEVLANEESLDVDFVDMNLGCPLDLVCDKGAGAKLMLRDSKLKGSVKGMLNVLNCPVTIKMRTGWSSEHPIAHELQRRVQGWQLDGIGAFMLHGRSRLQRYSRNADWDYIVQVAKSQKPDLPQIPGVCEL